MKAGVSFLAILLTAKMFQLFNTAVVRQPILKQNPWHFLSICVYLVYFLLKLFFTWFVLMTYFWLRNIRIKNQKGKLIKQVYNWYLKRKSFLNKNFKWTITGKKQDKLLPFSNHTKPRNSRFTKQRKMSLIFQPIKTVPLEN